jgi:photosystem II stability/assembly factor-like uncharacterized protein
VRNLDEPAISVKAPDKVVLIAVARAGNRLVAVGEHGVITYSDDNGNTWRQASVPVNVLLTAVRFATPADGWAVGQDGVILHTEDGGATWQVQLDGIRANRLTFQAAQIAAAAKSTSPGAPLAVKRANYFTAGGPDIPFLSIVASSPTEALAFGAYRMVMKTTDAGKTWQDWSLQVDDPLSHNLYDAAQIGTNICVAAETGLVFCSADGGATFPEVTAPATGTLFGILPTGDGGMLVFGVAGEAYRSADGGRSWSTIDLGEGSNLTAGTVLKSGKIVVVCEDGLVYISNDHARTFHQSPAVQPMALFGVSEAADGDLILVGNLGVLRIPARFLS